MSNIRITKQFNFETGHALYGYDGKCKNIHGHSYKLLVTVIGTPITDTSHYQPTSENMVIDFAAKIKGRLPKGILLHSIKLQETDTASAEWHASEN